VLLQLPQVLHVTRLGRAKELEGLPEWPERVKRDLIVSKETYFSVKRDLL